MNFQLALLTLCQGLFLVNNVTFIAINGLVGLSVAPVRYAYTRISCTPDNESHLEAATVDLSKVDAAPPALHPARLLSTW